MAIRAAAEKNGRERIGKERDTATDITTDLNTEEITDMNHPRKTDIYRETGTISQEIQEVSSRRSSRSREGLGAVFANLQQKLMAVSE